MPGKQLVQTYMEVGLVQRIEAYRAMQGRFQPTRTDVITTALDEWLTAQMEGQTTVSAPAHIVALGVMPIQESTPPDIRASRSKEAERSKRYRARKKEARAKAPQ